MKDKFSTPSRNIPQSGANQPDPRPPSGCGSGPMYEIADVECVRLVSFCEAPWLLWQTGQTHANPTAVVK